MGASCLASFMHYSAPATKWRVAAAATLFADCRSCRQCTPLLPPVRALLPAPAASCRWRHLGPPVPPQRALRLRYRCRCPLSQQAVGAVAITCLTLGDGLIEVFGSLQEAHRLLGRRSWLPAACSWRWRRQAGVPRRLAAARRLPPLRPGAAAAAPPSAPPTAALRCPGPLAAPLAWAGPFEPGGPGAAAADQPGHRAGMRGGRGARWHHTARCGRSCCCRLCVMSSAPHRPSFWAAE